MSEENVKLYTSWLKGTIAAIKKFSFYPAGHPSHAAAVAHPFELLQKILASDQKLVLSLVEDKFVVNGQAVTEHFEHNPVFTQFKSGAIKSFEIKPEIAQEEFKTFLNYFAKILGDRTYQQSLYDYLSEQALTTIVVGKVQYVAVSNKEEVISRTEKLKIDLKGQLAQSLKDNPQILRDIIFSGSLPAAELKSKYRIDLPPDKLVTIAQEEVGGLSDQEILNLISGKVKSELEKALTEEVQKKDDLEGLLQALQSQELRALFPRLEEILTRYGLFNPELLKKAVSQRWKKDEKILEQLKLLFSGQKSLAPPQIASLAQEILELKDREVSASALKSAGTALDNEKEEIRHTAKILLAEMLRKSLAANREYELNLVKEICLEKLKNVKFPESGYLELLKLVKPLTLALIKRKDYQSVKEILVSVRSHLHKEALPSEEIQKASHELIEESGKGESGKQLLSEWIQLPDPSQDLEAVIRLLGTNALLDEFLVLIGQSSPAVEQKAIRFLSSSPELAFSYFHSLVSNYLAQPAKSPEGKAHQIDAWKIKLSIKILGNTGHLQALYLLSKLRSDADAGLRLEVVHSLSHHSLAEAKVMLYPMLRDSDPLVRKEVIETLASHSDPKSVQTLTKHFTEDHRDRRQVCLALFKIGGEKVSDFFVTVVTGHTKPELGPAGKVEDEIRMAAFNYLAKNLTPRTAKQLEDYLVSRKKGLFSALKHDPLEDKIASLIYQRNPATGLPSRG